MVWRSAGDGENRKYDFAYDNVNRLSAADFNQLTSSTFNKTAGVDFSESNISYDANGNIKTYSRMGLLINASTTIDNLTYTYVNAGSVEYSNKLLNVRDASNDPLSKLGDFKTSALHPQNTAKTNATTFAALSVITDYTYDANGNLVRDYNKDIVTTAGTDGIQYNYLNLPSLITVKKATPPDKGTIAYTYDASGNKLTKVTTDNSTTGKTITTTTNYINGFVYESKTTSPANTPNDDYTDVLQFFGHEEGRVRFTPVAGTIPASFAYDYFIKDHLGNVRMVLTEEQQTIIYPAATLEGTFDASTNSMVNYEKLFYKIDNTKIISESGIASWVSPAETVANTKLYYNHNGNPPTNINYPAGCSPVQTTGSTKVYQLNATANKTGLEFMIKVMAGDKIDIFGKSYFLNTATVNNANSTPLDLLNLMANMLLSPGNAAAGKGLSATTLNTINTGQVPTGFFRGANGETTTIPKAYINYIFLDEQFKYAGGNYSRVGASGTVKDHWAADPQLQNITVPKNGYIFVYVSNESNLPVFFDNLQVIHKPGPILEETHYYPFGLTMAGISSRAAGNLENKRRFNRGSELQSKEFSDGSGLELYATQYRSLDPQLGRWWQIDPKPDYAQSLYSAMNNNPILNNDPLGDTAKPNVPSKVPDVKRNPKQDKLLTPGEIKKLKENGWDHSDKGRGGGKIDLYKDKKGNVYEKGKGNKGPGEPIGVNLNDLDKKEESETEINSNKVDAAPAKLSEANPSKRPWWAPVETQFDPVSGSGSSATIPGQKAGLNTASQVGAGYVIVKAIEILITVGTGGAASPILLF